MKTKIFLVSLLFSGLTLSALAQQGDERPVRKQISKEQKEAFKQTAKAARTAYLVTQIGLTEQELAKFLPLYNEYQQKLADTRKKSDNLKAAQKGEATADFTAANNESISLKIKELEIQKDYNAKFSKVISAEKVWQLHQAEKNFNKHNKQQAGRFGKHRAFRGHPGCPK